MIDAAEIEAAETPEEIGAIYAAHLCCCWDDEPLGHLARARRIELMGRIVVDAEAMTPDTNRSNDR